MEGVDWGSIVILLSLSLYIYIYINTYVGLVMKYLGYDFGGLF